MYVGWLTTKGNKRQTTHQRRSPLRDLKTATNSQKQSVSPYLHRVLASDKPIEIIQVTINDNGARVTKGEGQANTTIKRSYEQRVKREYCRTIPFKDHFKLVILKYCELQTNLYFSVLMRTYDVCGGHVVFSDVQISAYALLSVIKTRVASTCLQYARESLIDQNSRSIGPNSFKFSDL